MRVQCIGERSEMSIRSHGNIGLELEISKFISEMGKLKWEPLDIEMVEVQVISKSTLGKETSGQQKNSKTMVSRLPANGANGVEELEHYITTKGVMYDYNVSGV